jgi:hypothetical protein
LTDELDLLRALRKVLESAGNQGGVAESVVRELKTAGPDGAKSASGVLIGLPLRTSLAPLVSGRSREVSMLASLVAASGKSSAPMAGKQGKELSHILERWIKWRENRKLEDRVFRFRGLIASAVLGAVTGMIAALGPALSSLQLLTRGAGVGSGPGAVPLAAATMSMVSAALLGQFTAGRGFYLNAMASAAAFAVVWEAVSPLAVTPQAPVLWIK